MKLSILFILIFTTVNQTVLISQELHGKYVQSEDYLSFRKDSVTFEIQGNGGIISYWKGNGEYVFLDDFLLIKTTKYNGIRSYFEKLDIEKDQTILKLIDKEKNPISGAPVSLLDDHGELLQESFSDKNGQITFYNNSKAELIRINFLGYEDYKFRYLEKTQFEVTLLDIYIVENKTVVFKVNSKEDNRLELTLLATDFEETKNLKRKLKKLNRRMRKFKYSKRVFKIK